MARGGGVSSDAVEALLSASRALVGIAARSVADVDPDVTLPQYRALVVLASRGPQKVADIAAELGVAPSTGTRMCDRLIRKGLIRRHRLSTDRRVVRLVLTAPVDEAILQRRGVPAHCYLLNPVDFTRLAEAYAKLDEFHIQIERPA
jgi:DNA-binding MarR family transcriptional regulator